jgi:hypothetical protein
VRDLMGNNRWRVIRYCPDCGFTLGNHLPFKDYDVDSLPILDRDEQRRIIDAHWEARRTRKAAEREQADLEWRGNYEDYLRSDHWRRLRGFVLFRDQFMCQGCGCKVTAANSDGHHLSYYWLNQIGHSFAFEIVTLCLACHAEIHPHLSQHQRYNGNAAVRHA